MSITFSTRWKQYKNIIDNINKLKVQNSLFVARNTNSDIEKLRRQLFNDYEGFININNEIDSIILNTTLTNWFSKNCKVKRQNEILKWLEDTKIEDENTVRIIVDIVGEELSKLCFNGGCAFCPQVKGDENTCAEKLVMDIVKNSDRYNHVPDTKDNFELFLNGSTQFLQKETKIQESTSSPIEVIMFEALKPLADKYGYKIEREYSVKDEGRMEIRYSLDIVFINKKNKVILNIECDGLTYHRDYYNMADDRARDRWLLVRGIPVMRFTSREIFGDLKNCVIQTEHALNIVSKWSN